MLALLIAAALTAPGTFSTQAAYTSGHLLAMILQPQQEQQQQQQQQQHDMRKGCDVATTLASHDREQRRTRSAAQCANRNQLMGCGWNQCSRMMQSLYLCYCEHCCSWSPRSADQVACTCRWIQWAKKQTGRLQVASLTDLTRQLLAGRAIC
jgi:hypothetical protein